MLLLSSVQAMMCANHSLQSYFFQKRIFSVNNSFPAPQYGFYHLFNVIVSDLTKDKNITVR